MPAQSSRNSLTRAAEVRADGQPARGATGSRRGLAVVSLSMALVWLVLLPAVGRWSPVAARIDRHEAAGIDPSVKFYSELPVMPSIQRRLDRLRRSQPTLFWERRSAQSHPASCEGSLVARVRQSPSLSNRNVEHGPQ